MSVRPKRYESRGGRKVRAIKVTERNYKELINWIGRNATNVKMETSSATVTVTRTGEDVNPRLRLHIWHKGIRVARVGDYVFHVLNDDLSLTDGALYLLKGEDFEEKYTEIKK